MAARKINPEGVYKLGGIGGRGKHPSDYAGSCFTPTHWPLSQPHEIGRQSESSLTPIGEGVKQVMAVPKLRPATSTGLTTLDDFNREAKLRGIASPVLLGKFKANREKFGPDREGLFRMQCNNLLNNAANLIQSNFTEEELK